MANVAAPFGALQRGTASGPPNFASAGNPPFRILSTYNTAIGYGDLVTLVAGANPTGYINRWTAGSGSATYQVAGVFYGCRYLSTSQKKTVWNNFWPGSDAAADAEAFVCSDPNALFLIQSGDASVPIDYTYVGMTADVVMGTVDTVGGNGKMSLLKPVGSTNTQYLPFKVVDIVKDPPGVNGTDITTAYNDVVVAFNNQIFKSLLTIHS